MTDGLLPVAGDGEQYLHHSRGQEWLVSWHPGSEPPPAGKPHGAEGLCFTADGLAVSVTEDGATWVLPGGRPEPGETWRQTLDREVLEEACAVVLDASLLGYSRGVCVRGHERGLVLVRSHWRAQVSLLAWRPAFEIVARRLVSPHRAAWQFNASDGVALIYRRILVDAGVPRRCLANT